MATPPTSPTITAIARYPPVVPDPGAQPVQGRPRRRRNHQPARIRISRTRGRRISDRNWRWRSLTSHAEPSPVAVPARPCLVVAGQPWCALRRAAAMSLRQPRIRCVIQSLFHGSATPARMQARSCMMVPATPADDHDSNWPAGTFATTARRSLPLGSAGRAARRTRRAVHGATGSTLANLHGIGPPAHTREAETMPR